jgi:N-acetylglucosamine-6-phosphate deacetylase
MDSYVLVGANVCLENKVVPESIIVVESGVIKHIMKEEFYPLKGRYNIINLPSDSFVVPGFIDVHIHGANGSDIMDANLDSTFNIASSLLAHGTTGFLATTMSETDDNITKALKSIHDFSLEKGYDSAKYSDVYGVHLEGPYLSESKAGAQNPIHITQANIEQFKKWQDISGNSIKKVTTAPEADVDLSFVSYLKEEKIISSIGHTCCSAKEASKYIDAGSSSCTHMFNAMSGLDHRSPGALLPILMSNHIVSEIIADEVHISPEMLDFAFKMKGPSNLILVTDAMSAQGYGDGVFQLGGQLVEVKGNEARLENGTLAGSVLSMNKALLNMIKNTNCSLLDAIKMTSVNPAKQIGVFDKVGSISIGKKANLVVLDKNLQVLNVFKS